SCSKLVSSTLTSHTLFDVLMFLDSPQPGIVHSLSLSFYGTDPGGDHDDRRRRGGTATAHPAPAGVDCPRRLRNLRKPVRPFADRLRAGVTGPAGRGPGVSPLLLPPRRRPRAEPHDPVRPTRAPFGRRRRGDVCAAQPAARAGGVAARI